MRKFISSLFILLSSITCFGGEILLDENLRGESLLKEYEYTGVALEQTLPIYSYDSDSNLPVQIYGRNVVIVNNNSKIYLYVDNDGKIIVKCMEPLLHGANDYCRCSIFQENKGSSYWALIESENMDKIYFNEYFVANGLAITLKDKNGNSYQVIFQGKRVE